MNRPGLVIFGSYFFGIAIMAVLAFTDHSRHHEMRIVGLGTMAIQLAMLPLLVWRWRRAAQLREARTRHATALKAGR
jgi:hypothetical protein